MRMAPALRRKSDTSRVLRLRALAGGVIMRGRLRWLRWLLRSATIRGLGLVARSLEKTKLPEFSPGPSYDIVSVAIVERG